MDNRRREEEIGRKKAGEREATKGIGRGKMEED